jgi:outer membrane receptor for ferric coprogen and ferric-rhodotorulic acid
MRNTTSFPLSPLACATLLTCLACAPAWADTATATETQELNSIEVKAKALPSDTTERSPSYRARNTSGATGLSLSAKDTPQAVSVVTNQQIKDLGLTGINNLLSTVSGITVERPETDRTYYTARGFDITNFQFDGVGMPFTNGNQTGELDSALYDRVEVLRGANGLTSSTGNPSATINFVRKRPTAAFQASGAVSYGTWGSHREEADVSGALNEAGNVRGRAILVNQHKGSNLSNHENDRKVAGFTVDADITRDTTLSLGYTYQESRSKGVLWGALPLYDSNGNAISYDTSATTAQDWTYWNTKTTDTFARLSQDLGAGWQGEATVNYRHTEGDAKLYYVDGTPSVTDGSGLSGLTSAYQDHENRLQLDLRAKGGFKLAGREHEASLGANWGVNKTSQDSYYTGDTGYGYYQYISTTLGAVLNNGVTELPTYSQYTYNARLRDRRSSVYGATRWSLTDQLKLITGVNATHVMRTGVNYGVTSVYDITQTTPYVGSTYALTPESTVYGSYTEIFNPQTEVNANSQVLSAATGHNTEVGVKQDWLNKRVSTSVAAFQAKQNNIAEYAGYSTFSYYKGINATSTGLELDVAGQISDNWQVSGGITSMSIKDADGEDARTYVPRQTLHLNTMYQFASLPALKVGGSLKWQNDISRYQTTINDKKVYSTQDAYALVDLSASYQFNKQLKGQLQINNVTNQKYLTSLYWSQSYYGETRNASVSLNWTY